MKKTTRRGYAALSVAVAAAMGTVLALNGVAQAVTPPPASPLDWPATNGGLFTSGSYNGTVGQWNDDEFPSALPGSGSMPAWSPNGARIVTVSGDYLVTERYDGTDIKTLSGFSDGAPSDPTFWKGGRQIAFSMGGELYSGGADGAVSARPARVLPSPGGCDTHPSGGLTGVLYFQRTSSCDGDGSSSVYRYDSVTGAVTEVVSDASSPALSPSGEQIAFLRTVDGDPQLFVANTDGSDVRQVTNDDRVYGPETWTPDGTSITDSITGTFSLGDSTSTHDLVSVDPSTGAVKDLYTYNSTNAAYEGPRMVRFADIEGSSASDSNIRASRFVWNTVGQHGPGQSDAKTAVLVSDADSVDAPLAAGLAGVKGGPLLLTSATGLDSAVRTELKRVLPAGKTVYLVGGPSVLHSAVATAVTSLGYKTVRLSGSTRYATSLAVAKAISAKPKGILLATGTDYHSILDAEGAVAADGGSTVALYTDGSTLTKDVKAAIEALPASGTKVSSIGASAVTAVKNSGLGWDYGLGEINGSGNSGTSVAMAKGAYQQPEQVELADEASWKGGVTTVAEMARFGPVLWTSPHSLDDGDAAYLLDESASLKYGTAFAGEINSDVMYNAAEDSGITTFSGYYGAGQRAFTRPTDTAQLPPYRDAPAMD